VDQFFAWYNTEHQHSGIKYVTTNQGHFGLANDICEIRQSIFKATRGKHPKQWSRHVKLATTQIVEINHPRQMKSIEA
jgi:hypothetical protein